MAGLNTRLNSHFSLIVIPRNEGSLREALRPKADWDWDWPVKTYAGEERLRYLGSAIAHGCTFSNLVIPRNEQFPVKPVLRLNPRKYLRSFRSIHHWLVSEKQISLSSFPKCTWFLPSKSATYYYRRTLFRRIDCVVILQSLCQ